jgi:hypothetical protein
VLITRIHGLDLTACAEQRLLRGEHVPPVGREAEAAEKVFNFFFKIVYYYYYYYYFIYFVEQKKPASFEVRNV